MICCCHRVDGNNNLEDVIQAQGITEHEGCELLVTFKHLYCFIFIIILFVAL